LNEIVRYFAKEKEITMKIEQIYTGCLAQGAYYITSEGEAAIIDPLRETAPYIDRLAQDGVQLKYIFETHFHADFVSGHLDLSKKTGAPIVYGPLASPSYEALIAEDNQVFQLGKIQIKVLHTPGHTMESTSYLLLDELGAPHALFSGDTLFIGDVGRPDLAQKAANLTREELASKLFYSLRDKIMTLPDEVLVYPAHGAGSACGKNMRKETVSTIGEEKASNYALRANMSEAEFIKEVTDGLLPPPGYFGMNVAMNKHGYDSFENILKGGLQALSPAAFEAAAEETGALVLDTREAADFARSFVPRSVNIGLKGDFAPWVGSIVVDVKQPLLLVSEEGTEEEVITRLSRVGFDGVIGYLAGGIPAWEAAGKETDSVNRVSPEALEAAIKAGNAVVVDVRKESEYAAEHVEDAYSRPLAYINDWIPDFKEGENVFIHCAGGYRSMIAASMLQRRGYRNFKEIAGGFNALGELSIPKTDFVCQSKSFNV
jgi:hydroxyacylglutathione hydrolase